jgi:UDP-MurNAc hydroxylase
MVFLDYLRGHGTDGGRLMVPGAVMEVDGSGCQVRWPGSEQQAMEPFTDKEGYLRRYAARVAGQIAADKQRWPAGGIDVLAELKAWFEPLLELAGHIRAGVGGPVLLRLSSADEDGGEEIVIDFPAGEVRRYAGDACRYEFTIDRVLVERLIAEHEKDWVNSLFLSMRFRARRVGQYNEYVYTFFKCLAPDRLMYAERWYAEQSNDEEDIDLDGWVVQRRCPHMGGDLSRFGEIDGTTLTCTVHGWRFDLPTGRCLSSGGDRHRLRSSPAQAQKAAPVS